MSKIPFVQNFETAYGQAETLSPLVTRVLADNPGPFTYTGTGVFIIGTNEVAVIDPGPITPAHEAALDEALAGKTVIHILLTHHHADHSPMAAPFAEKHGCKVYGMALKPCKTDDEGVQLEAGNDTSFNPDIDVSSGDQFEGNGWTLEAIHTPGHTSNHICYALREENTLFSGDHVMGWSTSVVVSPDGHMGDYLRALEDIESRNFDIIRPTHGPAIKQVQPFLSAYIAHRHEREEQIEAALKGGLTDIFAIVEKIYAHIDKRLHPAAAHSVLSHLIHMQETGRVKCEGELGLQGEYGPV